jgi:ribosomal protein S18 acetylase RimI-like enzyme
MKATCDITILLFEGQINNISFPQKPRKNKQMASSSISEISNDFRWWLAQCYKSPPTSTEPLATIAYIYNDDVKPIFTLKTAFRYSQWINYIYIDPEQVLDTIAFNFLDKAVMPIFEGYSYSFMATVPTDDVHSMKTAVSELKTKYLWGQYDSCAMALELSKYNGNDFDPNNVPATVSKVVIVNTSLQLIDYIRIFIGSYGADTTSSTFDDYFNWFSMADTNNQYFTRFLVYNHSGEAVGCASLAYNPKTQNTFFNEISVRQDHRKQGIGEYLTRRLIHESGNRQAKHCTLNATTMGKPLYDRLGFEEYGEILYLYKSLQ